MQAANTQNIQSPASMSLGKVKHKLIHAGLACPVQLQCPHCSQGRAGLCVCIWAGTGVGIKVAVVSRWAGR